jgi:hypothetical protein
LPQFPLFYWTSKKLREPMSNLDWGAVLGGSLVGTGVAISIVALGTAAAVAYAVAGQPSAMVLAVAAAAFISLAILIASACGSYFAGRYRRPGPDWTIKARVTSDGAHGILVWAIVWCLGASVITATSLWAARPLVASYLGSAPVQERLIADVLVPLRSADVEDPRGMLREIMRTAVSQGAIAANDRELAANILASEGRISVNEAGERIDRLVREVREMWAHTGTMSAWLLLVVGAVSLLGSGTAYWSATAGGARRDEVLSRPEPPPPQSETPSPRSLNDRRRGGL